MGHAGRQLTDRGHLIVLFHHCHGFGLCLIRQIKFIDHEGAGDGDNNDDDHNTEPVEPVDFGAQFQPGTHHSGLLFNHHENKWGVGNLGGNKGIARNDGSPLTIGSQNRLRPR